MPNINRCEFCETELRPDGSCPRCDAEADELFRYYETEVSESMPEDEYQLENVEYEVWYTDPPLGEQEKIYLWGCSCPICSGAPHKDPIFRDRFERDFYGDGGLNGYMPATDRIRPDPKDETHRPIENTKYLAFDIEIAKIIPEGVQNWDRYRPFGISCAATVVDKSKPAVWHGRTSDGSIANQMSQEEVIQLVEYLQGEVNNGKKIVSWNGLGFDFSVLAEESGLYDACKALAYNHIDMMFHIFCLKGYPLGLDKAAKGMGLLGKSAGVGGANAAKYWQEGKHQEVLEYVRQDVVTTLDVFLAGEQNKSIHWTSNNGKLQSVFLPKGWISVSEARRIPLPDTSWMSNPWKRSKFTDWMTQKPNKDSKKSIWELLAKIFS